MYGYTIFHNELMNTLIDNVRNDRNANAYIFYGQKGLAKHEAARLFAMTLVCDNQTTSPCGQCRCCIESKADTNPDIVYVKREKDKASLGIDPVRDMINDSYIKPFYAKRKVYIIDEGDLMTPEAQNAFLKNLEEPPEYVVFIIVCEQEDNLLETVRSRAVKVNFPLVSDDIVRDYIEKKYPDEVRIEFLVKFCAGVPKSADEIINREDFEQIREDVLGLVPKILSKNKIYAYNVSQYFDMHKQNAQEICDLILLYLRDALITSMGGSDKIINADKTEKINILASTYPPSLIASAIDEVIYAKKMIARYVKTSAVAMRMVLAVK